MCSTFPSLYVSTRLRADAQTRSDTIYQLALPDLYKLHTIYERRATPTESKARDKYGHLGVKVVSTLDEVLADPEVDLVSTTACHRVSALFIASLGCRHCERSRSLRVCEGDLHFEIPTNDLI